MVRSSWQAALSCIMFGIVVSLGGLHVRYGVEPSYGLIAWLTIFTMLTAYFLSLSSGVKAHFGKDSDHGFIGLYFCLTLALIDIEVFLGSGDKNGMTPNRIVATTTGVLMAIVLGMFPPNVSGRERNIRANISTL